MASDDGPVPAMLRGSPALAAGAVDHAGWWSLDRAGVLNVYGPLEEAEARRIGDHAQVRQLQFARRFEVPVTTLRWLDEHVVARHPALGLRETFNGYGAFDDLRFVQHLPRLRSLGLAGRDAIDLQPIRDHLALVSLGVGGHGTSLRPLEGYASLEELGIGDRLKDVATIGTMARLASLSIGSPVPASLAFLGSLPRLTTLAFRLVAPRSFEELAGLPALCDLSIWRARKLETEAMAAIGRIAGLRRLELSELPRITSLASLGNPGLQVVELEGMKGLRSYASLAGLPDLRTLVIKDAITAAQLAELVALPRLEAVHVLASSVAALASRVWPFAVHAI